MDILLTLTDLASPTKSLHSVLSVDNELCSFIPMLLNIYDFIFIPISIFDMHKSFFRGNAQKQHYWDSRLH